MKKNKFNNMCHSWNYSKLNFLLCVFLLLIGYSYGQTTTYTINLTTKYQTITGFGASDCWSDELGKSWSTNSKDEIAKLLFSKQVDINGKPEGIGLSIWRFNVGAGSSEQGAGSNIGDYERRAQCFLLANGSYDWTKQAGQQYFLRKAKAYGVPNFVLFSNSPPVHFTKNGLANTNNNTTVTTSNLRTDKYVDFADFLTTVMSHFKTSEGINFNYISPINEPQWGWTDGQEGSPWTNTEMRNLTVELSAKLAAKNLVSKIMITEAGSYKYLTSTTAPNDKDRQIEDFFTSSSSNYIAPFISKKLIAGHSYWTDGNDIELINERKKIATEITRVDPTIEFHQTEFCFLTDTPTDETTSSYWDYGIRLAKIIHHDLVFANASSWSYWTAIGVERWSQMNRFYLLKENRTAGDY